MQDITAELLLNAYANGFFPMAKSRNDTTLHWFHPEMRGILPLDDFHVPKSLAKLLKKHPFTFSIDRTFPEVIKACAERAEDTWINDKIIALYCELHRMGFAHSVECWQNARSVDRASPELRPMEFSAENSGDNILVGGLYGVAIGGAFFGESMFSRASNASKSALVYLVERLRDCGYTLLDTQFSNEHLLQFGVIEIPREEYLARLQQALSVKVKSLD